MQIVFTTLTNTYVNGFVGGEIKNIEVFIRFIN
jgi:hypothetical protein